MTFPASIEIYMGTTERGLDGVSTTKLLARNMGKVALVSIRYFVISEAVEIGINVRVD